MSDNGRRIVAPLHVALGEYDTGWHDPAGSLARAGDVVARAAEGGARLVALPETSTTGWTMEPLGRAEPLGGKQTDTLGKIAQAHGVWILAGLAVLDNDRAPGPGSAAAVSNAAVFFEPSGRISAVYRKQRLFAYAGEHEHYAAGRESAIIEIDGVRVSPFICYDLRFPELFRAVAPDVDAFLLIANWPVARAAHWDILLRARPIENLCYIVAVNRIGDGGGVAYDGRSVAYGPWGEELPDVGAGAAPPAGVSRPKIVAIDPGRVAEIRARYPFLRDREDPTGAGSRERFILGRV